MAELPELETLRRELEKESVGKRFKTPEVTGTKVDQARRRQEGVPGPARGGQGEVGRPAGPVPRRQPRQRRAAPPRPRRRRATSRRSRPGPPPPRARSLTLAFTQGGQIRLVDPSGTAQAFVVATDAVAEEAPGAGRPRARPGRRPGVVDVLRPGRCSARNVKLKALLMDQEVVAGIGPIYSDEILWEAGPALRPHLQRAVVAGDPPAVPGPGRDAPRGRQAPGHHGRRPALRRPLRQARRLPGRAQGLRPGGRALPPLPGARSPRPASPTSPLYFCEACQV